jgi:hypothetical protein
MSHRRPNIDRNKTPANRFAAINRLMGKAPIRDDAQRDIEIAAHIALARLMKGGDKESLYILATALDVSHELAVQGCGKSSLREIEQGMAALIRTKKAANLSGVWKFDEAAAEAVKIAVAIHDAQLETASRALVVKVMREVLTRVESGSHDTEFEATLLAA